uniref:Ig-like domain-containing protein n=4 Tax=Cebus TaxID=9513 RepID=A0A2K5QAX1_CEBIM
MAALIVTLIALSSPLALQFECRPLNGTEHTYNREEYVGSTLGRPDQQYYDSREDIMEQTRAAADTVCRRDDRIPERFLVPRRVQPKVTVYPAKTQPLQHHSLLVCSVSGFYPGSIEVRWFRNDQEEKAGVVSTGLIQNGGWTFQTLVMLETVPQSGEVYISQVEHPSVMSPLTVQWRAQSESAQSKMLSGLRGFVLGLLFLGNQKGRSALWPSGNAF